MDVVQTFIKIALLKPYLPLTRIFSHSICHLSHCHYSNPISLSLEPFLTLTLTLVASKLLSLSVFAAVTTLQKVVGVQASF